eukprot:1785671-Alexandrium_andersonii.AAC.1
MQRPRPERAKAQALGLSGRRARVRTASREATLASGPTASSGLNGELRIARIALRSSAHGAPERESDA